MWEPSNRAKRGLNGRKTLMMMMMIFQAKCLLSTLYVCICGCAEQNFDHKNLLRPETVIIGVAGLAVGIVVCLVSQYLAGQLNNISYLIFNYMSDDR